MFFADGRIESKEEWVNRKTQKPICAKRQKRHRIAPPVFVLENFKKKASTKFPVLRFFNVTGCGMRTIKVCKKQLINAVEMTRRDQNF